MRKIFTWILWFFLFVILAAVIYFVWTQFFGGGEDSAGGTVVLDCNSECAARAQCGTTVNSPQVPVVLGGLDGPVLAANLHDLFIASGVTVEVQETWTGEVQQADGRTFNEKFSRVEFRNNFGDIQKAGWFPDWCVKYP
jgi:hypothetical protein